MKQKYKVGDKVFWRNYDDEPVIVGVVVEADLTTRPGKNHFYLTVEYTTRSGKRMCMGTPDYMLLGKVQHTKNIIQGPWGQQ